MYLILTSLEYVMLRVVCSYPSQRMTPALLLRGTILDKTYGTDKNLYILLFYYQKFGPIYYGPP